MPSYMQGPNHPDLFPRADFPIDLTAPATFGVRIGVVARSGAHPVLKVDGTVVAEKDYPAGDRDQNVRDTMSAPIPAGHHVIEFTNNGPDWVRASEFTLTPFGPTLAALGKADDDSVALWIRSTEGDNAPRTGSIRVPAGLKAGTYSVLWYDTATGAVTSRQTVSVSADQPLALQTPPIGHDVAMFAERIQH